MGCCASRNHHHRPSDPESAADEAQMRDLQARVQSDRWGSNTARPTLPAFLPPPYHVDGMADVGSGTMQAFSVTSGDVVDPPTTGLPTTVKLLPNPSVQTYTTS